jgi:AcrR family transcriptional regulator
MDGRRKDRRTVIADTAVAILASHGALTHRAVDAAAGLPAGSTSYYFRSREALLVATAERLAVLDLAGEPGGLAADGRTPQSEQTAPTTPEELADLLAGLVFAQLTTHRDRTMARYRLSLEAAHFPQVAATLAELGSRFTVAATELLTRIGAGHPAADARAVIAVCAGLVFESTVGAQQPYSLAEVRAVLGDVLRARVSPGTAAMSGNG